MNTSSQIKPVHLVLEGSVSKLPSELQVRNFLIDTVVDIGMKPIGRQMVVDTNTALIGFQIIADSHLAVHVDKASQQLFLDCFSCKEYDVGLVIALAEYEFGLSNLHCRVMERAVPADT